MTAAGVHSPGPIASCRIVCPARSSARNCGTKSRNELRYEKNPVLLFPSNYLGALFHSAALTHFPAFLDGKLAETSARQLETFVSALRTASQATPSHPVDHAVEGHLVLHRRPRKYPGRKNRWTSTPADPLRLRTIGRRE